jgi:tripartite-type tricarboxylate transporter receptor subunit TctC
MLYCMQRAKEGRRAMKPSTWLVARILAAAFAVMGLAAPAFGYPDKPVRIVVGAPPGSPGDLSVRLLADKLPAFLNQPFLIENRPGAGGNIAAEVVASSPPDGYTILEFPDTLLTINPGIYTRLGFNPAELVPLTYLATFSQMFVCHPTVKAKTLQELVTAARTETITSASGGNGVPGHVALELLKSITGTNLVHVPFKGPSPAAQSILGAQVHCGFLATPVVGPHVKAGKLTGLAVSGTKRSRVAPDVPTAEEGGLVGYDATFAEVLYVRRGTPKAVIDALNDAITRAIAQPDVRQRLLAADLEPLANTAAAAAERLRHDIEKWRTVLHTMNLKLD